jgi:hypothetical protein
VKLNIVKNSGKGCGGAGRHLSGFCTKKQENSGKYLDSFLFLMRNMETQNAGKENAARGKTKRCTRKLPTPHAELAIITRGDWQFPTIKMTMKRGIFSRKARFS